MLLAIDIGNTSIHVGVFEGEELRATWQIASDVHRKTDEYAVILLDLMAHHGLKTTDITDAVMCSVVPPLIGTYAEFCEQYLKVTPLIVGAGVKTGVKIRMDNPREVGADRIVHAVAAHQLYGGPAIIVDMGTATTFDSISREGDYLGGVIAPGIGIAAEALFMRTAMLPRVELTRPKKAIGTNTVTAMQSGLVFGYVGLVEGIIARIQAELGEKATVVATGGYSKIIAKETKIFDAVNLDLVLIGLRLVYLMNKE